MMNSVRVVRVSALAVLSALMLVACPQSNVIEINFDADPGILRGKWGGMFEEQCISPLVLLGWNTSNPELVGLRYTALNSGESVIKVSTWDTSSGAKKFEWSLPGTANTFRYAAHANRVAAYSLERVNFFDSSNGAALTRFELPPGEGANLADVVLSQNLERLLRFVAEPGASSPSQQSRRAQVFDLNIGKLVLNLPIAGTPYSAALSSDGSLLALNIYKVGIQIYDISSGKLRLSLPFGFSSPLQFSPDQKYLSSGQQVWRLEDGKAVLPVVANGAGDRTTILALNNSRVIAYSTKFYPDSMLAVYRLEDGGLESKGLSNERELPFSPNPTTGEFALSNLQTCSVQLFDPNGQAGQRLALEPLQNVPITLELTANFVNRDGYTVTGSATLQNKSYGVEGKVSGNEDNQFITSQSVAPRLPTAELNLLENGVVKYALRLSGGRGAAKYFASSAYALEDAPAVNRSYNLTLTKP